MKKAFLIVVGILLFISIINSCKHVPEPMPVPTGTQPPGNTNDPIAGGEQTCDPDTVYFQNKVLPLLISSCAKSNCHDAVSHQDGVQLTSYQLIMNTADVDPFDPGGSKLYKVLNENDPDKVMPRPPSSPLTQQEKDIIYNWIMQGAQNNACNDCDTTTITYTAAIVPMINNNCKGCHNPSFLSGGIDLTNYSTVRSIALSGQFMGVIDHQPGYPPMPRGAAKLNDCKIAQVSKWIDAGTQNN